MLVPGVLRINIVAVIFQIVGVFNLFKTEIRHVTARSGLHGGHAPVAVPIDVLHDPFSGDMFTVFYVEASVIVPWIICPVFAGASVVPCQFQSVFSFLSKLFHKKRRLCRQRLMHKVRQAIPSTD